MRHYSNIQALRAIAAIMVLCIHSIGFPQGMVLIINWPLPFLWGFGPAGVDVFFVISGFIISSVAANSCYDNTQTSSYSIARDFLIKRIMRIYPIYWFVLSLAIITSFYITLSASNKILGRAMISFYTLVEHKNQYLQPAWTLCYEIYFYLTVTIIIVLFKKYFFSALFAWSAFTIFLIYIGYYNNIGPMIPTNPMILEFIFGIVVAFLVYKKIIISPTVMLAIGVALFAVGTYLNMYDTNWQDYFPRVFRFGLSSAFIVYGLIGVEIRHSFILPKLLQKLGDASYSLYIWHVLILYTVLTILYPYMGNSQIVRTLLIATIILATIVFSTYFYFKIEKSFLRYVNKILSNNIDKREKYFHVSMIKLNLFVLFFGFLLYLYFIVYQYNHYFVK